MTVRKLNPQATDPDDVKSWDLPYVEQPRVEDDTKTNALNRKSTWRYEPPEPEEEILPPTAEEIEAIRQHAYEEGFAEGKREGFEQGKTEGLEAGTQEGHAQGLEAGHSEGLAQGRESIEAQGKVWQQLIDALHNPVAQISEKAHQELILLAVALAKSVIDVEVKSNQDVVLEALKSALHSLPINENKVHIRMHPDDIELVKVEFDATHISEQQWHFIASPEMSRGGCDISTENNAVDFSIERRSKDVIETFLLQQGLADGSK